MRTVIIIVAGACLAFGVTDVIIRPSPEAKAPSPTTLSDIQQHREENRAPPVAKPAPPANSTASNESLGHVADAKEQLNRSMVGLPFERSPSVVNSCDHVRNDLCKQLDRFLERMSAEPRDPDWAPRMEQFIVRSLAVEEEGALRIRALECRKTRCALEVASEAQQYGIQKTWDLGDVDLKETGAAALGAERDPSTGLVTYVNVHTWLRKSAPYDDD